MAFYLCLREQKDNPSEEKMIRFVRFAMPHTTVHHSRNVCVSVWNAVTLMGDGRLLSYQVNTHLPSATHTHTLPRNHTHILLTLHKVTTESFLMK